MHAVVLAIATAGGLGRVPWAPGTVASLAAVPLVPGLGWLAARAPLAHAAVVVGVAAVAAWAAGRAELALGEHDARCVVADEVSGMVAGSCLVPATWTAALVLFVWFRVFDVWKPPPVRLIDRRWRGGLGVVGDDLVAAVYAGLATRAVLAFA